MVYNIKLGMWRQQHPEIPGVKLTGRERLLEFTVLEAMPSDAALCVHWSEEPELNGVWYLHRVWRRIEGTFVESQVGRLLPGDEVVVWVQRRDCDV